MCNAPAMSSTASIRKWSSIPVPRSLGTACADLCAAPFVASRYSRDGRKISGKRKRPPPTGEYTFHSNHHFGAVGPMTGMTTISQPVMVVENQAFGNRAYCTINEGLGKVMRFGGNDAEVLNRLRCIATTWARSVGGVESERRNRHEEHHRARSRHGRRNAPAQRRLLGTVPARDRAALRAHANDQRSSPTC